MNYPNCLPARTLALLAAEPARRFTSGEIAAALGATVAQVVDVLPGLRAAGQIVRYGERRHYQYGIPFGLNIAEALGGMKKEMPK